MGWGFNEKVYVKHLAKAQKKIHSMSVVIIVMIYKKTCFHIKYGWRCSPETLLTGGFVKANFKNFAFVEWTKLVLILMLPLLLLETRFSRWVLAAR